MGKYSDFFDSSYEEASKKDKPRFGLTRPETQPAKSGQTTAPAPAEDEGVGIGDYASAFGMGAGQLVSGAGWLFGSDTLEKLGRDTTDYWQNQLSDAMRESMSKKFINDDYSLGDAVSDPNSWGAVIVQSLPAMVPGVGAAGITTKAAQLLGAGARTAALTGAAAGSAAEGGTSAGMIGEETKQTVMNAPEEQLAESPMYQDLLKVTTPEDARRQVAEKAAEAAALPAGVATAILGTAFNKFVGDAVTGSLSKRLMKEGAHGALLEGATEAAQTGAEVASKQSALNEYANQPYSGSAALNEIVSGAGAGSASGGLIGLAGAMSSQGDEAPPEPTTADRVREARESAKAAGGDSLDAARAGSQAMAEEAAQKAAQKPKRAADLAGDSIDAMSGRLTKVEDAILSAGVDEAQAQLMRDQAIGSELEKNADQLAGDFVTKRLRQRAPDAMEQAAQQQAAGDIDGAATTLAGALEAEPQMPTSARQSQTFGRALRRMVEQTDLRTGQPLTRPNSADEVSGKASPQTADRQISSNDRPEPAFDKPLDDIGPAVRASQESDFAADKPISGRVPEDVAAQANKAGEEKPAEPLRLAAPDYISLPGPVAGNANTGMDQATPERMTETGGFDERLRLQKSMGGARPQDQVDANEIDAAAQETNTSPSEAQIEAGNYKKGRVRLHGLDIAIENPKGSTRSGTDPDGKNWQSTMAHHYGDIKGTVAADGDNLDVFVGPEPESDRVFVIDQVNKDGTFDEHKVMMGFRSEKDAREGYLANYEKGWKVGPITEMSADEFRDWVDNGDLSGPVDQASAQSEDQPRNQADDGQAVPESGDRDAPRQQDDTKGAEKSADEGDAERDNTHNDAPENPSNDQPGTDLEATTDNEREAGSLQNEEPDLGSSPDEGVDAGQREARLRSLTKTRQAERQTFKHGLEQVTSPEDAAHVLAPFRKEAQETMLGLVLDKNQKPLGIVRHTKGTKDASAVYPVEFVGDITMVPGAHSVWLSHNHPSGSTDPSEADIDITKRLKPMLENAGIELNGHVIVAWGRNATSFAEADGGFREIDTRAASRKQPIPVLERQIAKSGDTERRIVKGPEDAVHALQEIADADQTGVLLLDNRRRAVGFMDLSEYDLDALRGTGAYRDVVEAIARTNANATIVQFALGQGPNANIQRMLDELSKDGGPSFLDAIEVKGDEDSPTYQSLSELARDTRGGPWFSRGYARQKGDPLTAQRVRMIANSLMRDWKGRPEVVVGDSINEFPQGLQYAIRKAGAERDMRAVYWDGTVYMLASRFTSRSAVEEILLHEVIGTHGLFQFLGDELRPELERVWMNFAGSDLANQIIYDYFPKDDFDAKKREHRLTVAAELLAHMAESGKHRKLWTRIVAAVRKALRKMNIKLKMSENDLLNLLRGAQKVVERGGLSMPSRFDQWQAPAPSFSRAGRSGSDRAPWPDDFPKVPFAAPLGAAKKHPRYEAAKSGDLDAARELVDDLVTEDSLDRVRQAIGDEKPVVVPVVSEEATGRNWIPAAYAAKLAKELGLEPDAAIVQSVRAKRTGTGSDYRLANHAVFDGPVEPGQKYLVVDDTMTMGGTLAGLRGHIEANGGTVVAASALTGFGTAGQLALTQKMRQSLWDKHGEALDEYLKSEFGYGIDSLTQGESGHFRKAVSVDAIRDRIAAARVGQGDGSTDEGLSPSFSRSRSPDGNDSPADLPQVEETDYDEAAQYFRQFQAENGAQRGPGPQREVPGRTVAGRPAKRGWRQATSVRGESGNAAPVYRGSAQRLSAEDFGSDRIGRATGNPSAALGVWFTTDPTDAGRYGSVSDYYTDIRNPRVYTPDEIPAFDSVEEARELRDQLASDGYDGIVFDYSDIDGPMHIIAFEPDQVIEPDGFEDQPMFSRSRATTQSAGEYFTDLDEDQQAALAKIAPKTPRQRASDWIEQQSDRWATKLRQGMVDRFAALKDVDEALHGRDVVENSTASSSWVLAQMSGSAAGALQAMLTAGRIKLNEQQKVVDLVDGESTGLNDTLKKLGNAAEIERFFGWIAGNRSSRLMSEGRENLFEPDEVDALKRLNEGSTDAGNNRRELYAEVFREFQQHRDDVLGIAEASGIITPEQRETWANEFYVPFYRLADDEGGFTGPKSSGGITRQEAYKRLKGGTQNLNDLLENTMMNFHHLLQASLKNQAAVQAMENAEELGIARTTTDAARNPENSTFVMRDGQKVYYEIDDPLVFKAVTALAHPGMNSTAMKVMRSFKRLFTNFTTITPQFVIANLLRDSMQASATSEVSKNFLRNMVGGAKTYKDQRMRARMMASGGSFSFGHLYGENPDELRLQITGGLARSDILRSPSMVPTVVRSLWRRWNEATEFTENINRAAIFEQNLSDRGELYAAFKARDLMNFSQHGAWPAMRILIDVVPFLNARLQGLDKIYRAGVKPSAMLAMGKGTASDRQAAGRFWVVSGALALASMALYLANKDDEEYQKLEDWQKDTYWFIRTGKDTAIFIPKPFEVGAIATLVERLTEQAVDDTATGKLFAQRLGHMLTDTFAFSPVPQMIQPAMDVYANRDSFTGRPIESLGMQRLSPSLRRRESTTKLADLIGSATEAVFGPDGTFTYSPVQVDHLIRGYFGAVGAWTAGVVDTIARTASGETQPADYWYENQPIRRFYKNLGDEPRYTRYGTIFYDALQEVNQVYADIQEYKELGRLKDAKDLIEENASKLKYRRTLNRIQRKMSKINGAMDQIRRGEGSPEYKRRELDRLRAMKNRMQEVVGQKLLELNADS